ncbi:hypothetical protein [Jiella pelagia]|uniref:SGNH hydrolase-type esterase domain-containing protein n=1 Tax=Jiella pelagia TaxID=2986949 RepID=A0ABY7C4Z7_9HYPH|nr:hypothetical protein [Jiella pelagia]WAP70902.1 hypothetical protein OH818_13530 [Jiella pelagia]
MTDDDQDNPFAPISYEDYVSLAGDLNKRETFVAYSIVQRGAGGFDFRIAPNPDLVEMSEDEAKLENAMSIGNSTDRAARALGFAKDRIFNRSKPVIVSEGDSWFQFPILIDDVIDHLKDDYAILSLGAAGDTAANMVDGPVAAGGAEYLGQLKAQAKDVRAFLFSAAGNDIIGEDPVTKVSALQGILRPFNGDLTDVGGHIDQVEVGRRIATLSARYAKVIATIRTAPGLQRLPILFHGYDYCFPWPWGEDDPRKPGYAARDEWLGEPFAKRGFPSATDAALALRRNILKALIDRLYNMLHGLAGPSSQSLIWVVDCRGAMPSVTDWNDEIHGTSDGFAKVAIRFKKAMTEALAAGGA